jgi:hypothetical protein
MSASLDSPVALAPAGPLPIAAPAEPANCLTCGAALLGPYCHQCGDGVPDEGRLTTPRLLRQGIHELSDVDSKTLRTFAALFRKPGLLTAEFLARRTHQFLSPLKVYLTAFTVMTLVYSIGPVRMIDPERLVRTPGVTEKFASVINSAAARQHVGREQIISDWGERWATYFQWSQLLYVVFVAVLLTIVYWSARRHFAEHVVFALHFLAFGFLLSAALYPVHYALGMAPSRANSLESLCYMVAIGVYCYVAGVRVYSKRGVSGTIRAGAIAFGAQAIVSIVMVTVSMIAIGMVAMKH